MRHWHCYSRTISFHIRPTVQLMHSPISFARRGPYRKVTPAAEASQQSSHSVPNTEPPASLVAIIKDRSEQNAWAPSPLCATAYTFNTKRLRPADAVHTATLLRTNLLTDPP